MRNQRSAFAKRRTSSSRRRARTEVSFGQRQLPDALIEVDELRRIFEREHWDDELVRQRRARTLVLSRPRKLR